MILLTNPLEIASKCHTKNVNKIFFLFWLRGTMSFLYIFFSHMIVFSLNSWSNVVYSKNILELTDRHIWWIYCDQGWQTHHRLSAGHPNPPLVARVKSCEASALQQPKSKEQQRVGQTKKLPSTKYSDHHRPSPTQSRELNISIPIKPNKKIGRKFTWIKNSRPPIHFDSLLPNANKCNNPYFN